MVSHGQSGTIDTSFGTDGIVTTQISTAYNLGMASVVQQDGKIIVAGYAGTSATYEAALVRYNEDGTLDSSFGNSGTLIIPIGSAKSYIEDVTLQDDGKIVLGARTYDNVSGDFAVVRLNMDGSLDNSFGTNGIAIANSGGTDVSASILIADDGKIYLAGDTDQNFSIAKFNANGTLDTSFGTNGWFMTTFDGSMSIIEQIAFQNDGKIVMGGFAINSVGTYQMAAARINADGTLDSSFGIGGKVTLNFGVEHDIAVAIALQTDGKIVLGGHTFIRSNPRLAYDFAVVRLNTDGSFDTTYGNNGVATAQVVDEANYTNGMIIQADDKVVLGGRTVKLTDYDFAMVRFDINGQLDTTFGNNGKVSTDVDGREDNGYAIAMQPDTKIILAGYSYTVSGDTSDFVVARYHNDETAGVDDNLNNKFRVYPNPAREQLTIEMNDASSIYQLKIFDMLGKRVYNTEIQGMGQIDVSALAAGTYLVKLNSNSNTSTVRFVKQ